VFNINRKLIAVILWVLVSSNSWANSDPTRPFFAESLTAKTKQHSALKLQTIIKTDQRYKAVINGNLVNNGDRVLGYTVKKITANTALLSKAEKQLTLALFANTKLIKTVKK